MWAISVSVANRFWSKVDIGEADECWPWKAGLDTHGYGQFKLEGKKTLCHRFVFFLIHNRWPEPCCLHSCDNPACCNPSHLNEGTHSRNMQDMYDRNRVSRKGEKNPRAKLTQDEVVSLRTNPLRGQELKEYSEKKFVTPSTIYMVQRGDTW